MTPLLQAIGSHKLLIDHYLNNYFDQKRQSFSILDSHLVELLDTLSAQTLRSGKRIRPFLVGQGYELAGGTSPELEIELGAGIELLHQYFLVHDDIVDRDEKRYGDQSLHEKWKIRFQERYGKSDSHLGLSLGLIGGDLLHTLATEIILMMHTDEVIKTRLLSKLHETIYATIAGWQIHFFMNHEPLTAVTAEDYLKGMELVSARYTFVDPLHMGMMLANQVSMGDSLARYGRAAGMAFQIRDDVLGMFGDSTTTGKPVGNDFREGKKTLLVLHAYQNGTIVHKKFIETYLGTNIDQSQLEQVQTIMIETGALDASNRLAKEYAHTAKQALQSIKTKQSNVVEILAELADFVVNRES